MKSLQQAEIGAALDAVDAGYARLRAACSDSVGNAWAYQMVCVAVAPSEWSSIDGCDH
ncbi:MAG TPA: hypothetical protein VJR50_08880 [Mycobacterium sp.]|nr:hypothetical protein [Mycobacterium sp.]